MTKPAAQLEREIAEFLAKPQKLGDPDWEREWAGLLAEKHSKARIPTVDELARAFAYIEREYVIHDGRIDGEQWAEGLAFGQRHTPDEHDKHQAREAIKQLSHAAWLRVAERANRLSLDQGEASQYGRSSTTHALIKTNAKGHGAARRFSAPSHVGHSAVRTLSSEQLAALRVFANANGRNWKSALNDAWSSGRYANYNGTDDEGSLQQIRNVFGPAWLARFSFDAEKTHRRSLK